MSLRKNREVKTDTAMAKIKMLAAIMPPSLEKLAQPDLNTLLNEVKNILL